jgi:hypothetical protein
LSIQSNYLRWPTSDDQVLWQAPTILGKLGPYIVNGSVHFGDSVTFALWTWVIQLANLPRLAVGGDFEHGSAGYVGFGA